MDYPPSKRLKSMNQEDDPFGDEEEFSLANLDEIDIIDSQAVDGNTATSSNPAYSGLHHQEQPNKHFPFAKARANNSTDCHVTPGSRETLGNGQPWKPDKDQYYRELEAQQAQLKRKLKEVEEEILVKNGEIRVLRDSLKGAQQEKEAQHQTHLLLQQQRLKEQSDREKELTKKVQSLQSELQFKEAEMMEVKTRLQNTERINKTQASPLPRNSPKVLSSVVQMHHGSGSSSSTSSPTGSGFITKEMFSAQLPPRTTPVKIPGQARSREDRQPSSSRSSDSKEVPPHPDPFLCSARPQHQQQGPLLLRLLLQQSLAPSCLGLCQLLSLSPDALPAQLNGYISGLALSSGSSPVPDQKDRTRTRTNGSSHVQNLAVAGLNMMSLPPTHTHSWPGPNSHSVAGIRSRKRSCPGAVHLLPLLDHHLTRFCHTLDALRTSRGGGGGTSTSGGAVPGVSAVSGVPSTSSSSRASCGLEEAGGVSIEELGLAAVRVLSLLLEHSDEVVEAVLSESSQQQETENQATVDVREKTDASKRSTATLSDVRQQPQHAVMRCLLQLCDPCFSASASQKEVLVQTSLKTLCVLMERTSHTHIHRLQCVLSRGFLSACLSGDSVVQTMSVSVSVLESVADHDQLDDLLCSQHEACPFLKLFHYIRFRPDRQATHAQWLLLDLQVVRLLSRLFTQRVKPWSSYVRSHCHCYTELVQTLVVVLHRQWLDIRGRETVPDQSGQPWWLCPGVELLREALVLLHWMLLHHSSFSECCRPVLHMYDQVIPAVRDTLRRVPDLLESEELALDEICRSETDDAEDMDTDTGS